jgi:alpha,alpha-trehalose phosphorylase
MAGGWTVAVAGFGGMRDHDGRLLFAPRLPPQLSRLRFRVVYQGRILEVEIGTEQAVYRLVDGEPLDVEHHGRRITVGERDISVGIPPAPAVSPVRQPHGAEPRRRSR